MGEWKRQSGSCQGLTAVPAEPALSNAHLTKTQKLAENFFFFGYGKTPK